MGRKDASTTSELNFTIKSAKRRDAERPFSKIPKITIESIAKIPLGWMFDADRKRRRTPLFTARNSNTLLCSPGCFHAKPQTFLHREDPNAGRRDLYISGRRNHKTMMSNPGFVLILLAFNENWLTSLSTRCWALELGSRGRRLRTNTRATLCAADPHRRNRAFSSSHFLWMCSQLASNGLGVNRGDALFHLHRGTAKFLSWSSRCATSTDGVENWSCLSSNAPKCPSHTGTQICVWSGAWRGQGGTNGGNGEFAAILDWSKRWFVVLVYTAGKPKYPLFFKYSTI